jgi:hypothetical protein
MQTLTFTTRAGLKFTIEALADIGHAIEGKVIKGRKNFVGRVMVFPKNDMGRFVVVSKAEA